MTASPLIQHPDEAVALPSRYFGSIDYYATLAAYGRALIDGAGRFDKRQKDFHRCDIVDTQGRLQLTVPIRKPVGIKDARWSDIQVSDHGDWWHVHRVSLESAYGRTPFFEYYRDRIFAEITGEAADEPMLRLNMRLDAIVRDILGITTQVEVAEDPVAVAAIPTLRPMEYYQVRAAKFGFVGGLSILDLIFNMGPESPLILKRLRAHPTRNVNAGAVDF